MSKLNTVLLLCGVAVGMYAVDRLVTEPAAEELSQLEYCDMVQLNIDSAGQYGWPDFNRNFLEVCPQ